VTIESEADRLAMIQAVGGEEFDTGYTERLWGVFDRDHALAFAGEHTSSVKRVTLQCRSSDVAAHSLVKDSVIRRLADDSSYRVRDFEPDGTGMTVLVLRG
jgi:hypothetical protein